MEILENLPFDEYLKLPRLSSSALKDFIKSPQYFIWRKTNPMKESDAMKLGTMVHTWLLENHKFQHEYYPIEKYDRRTKAGKESYQAALNAAGDRILMEKDVINKFTQFKPYNDTKNEVTVLFEIMGIPCKARFDVLLSNGFEDIKTIMDIFKVEKQFYNFGYYIQAGFYQLAYKAAFGDYPEVVKFTFISTGDFVVMNTYEVEFPYLEYGREEAFKYIMKYGECLANDNWPLQLGTTINMPGWL